MIFDILQPGFCHLQSTWEQLMSDPKTIDALLKEERIIDPPEEFRRSAVVQSEDIYTEAEADIEGFWEQQAERLQWSERWTRTMEWDPPWVKWFIGGRLNVTVNCLDRHLNNFPDRVAYYWEGEPGDSRQITYRELHEEVCRFRAIACDAQCQDDTTDFHAADTHHVGPG